MAHDDAAIVKVSALFDPEPETWGLRGDPYLWRALREHLSGMDIPAPAEEVVSRPSHAPAMATGHRSRQEADRWSARWSAGIPHR